MEGGPKVTTLKSILDKENEQFGDTEDPLVVATLLKQFLKDLHEPFMTFNLYPVFMGISCIQNEQEKKVALKKALTSLPKNNYNLLRLLLKYFSEISSAAHHPNSVFLKSNDLPLVFGTLLLKPHNDNPLISIIDLYSNFQLMQYLSLNFENLIKQISIQEAEDKTDFEKEARKLYSKHCLSILKALKNAKSSSTHPEKWKKKIYEIGNQLKEGNLLTAQEIIKAAQNDKVAGSTPTSSPRTKHKTPDSDTSTHSEESQFQFFTTCIAKLCADDAVSELKSKSRSQVEAKNKRKKLAKSQTDKPQKHIVADKVLDELDAETYDRPFVIVVPTYEDDELNASSSSYFSDEEYVVSSNNMEIEDLIKHFCPEDAKEEEKMEYRRMLRALLVDDL
uniref:Rho-GAP domain-containing protein n=1 Tax=Arcella intermedia TaxID=1963864 RepID=A0A6B2L687_9EUKA